MKISLDWIGEYVNLPEHLTDDDLARDLTLKTVEVESQTILDESHWKDPILEVDNKSLTNRPDLWGHYGIAREFAAIYQTPLKQLHQQPAIRPTPCAELIGEVDGALCRRLALVEFTLDHDVPSPLWLRNRLARLGQATVNLLVDLSNYVMLATGQPIHIYDRDKLSLPLSAVFSPDTVQIDLLNGQRVSIPAPAPLIRDNNGPVAVAGIMGGAESAIESGSRRFIFEAACFQPRPVRRAAQTLGLRTESATRFEKGLDTQRVDQAVDLFLVLLATTAPGSAAIRWQDYDPSPTAGSPITVSTDFLNSRIGLELDAEEIRKTLQALGFTVIVESGAITVTPPTWRSTGDISIPEDIVEEVARIHGYDSIPTARVGGTFVHLSPTELWPVDRRIREQLAARAGLQEIVTYPWTSDQMLRAAELDSVSKVTLDAASAPDRSTLRPSLVPNLLEAVVQNLRYTEEFGIFEIGTVFSNAQYTPIVDQFESIPSQAKHAAAMLVGSNGQALFLRAKGILEILRRHCQLVDLQFDNHFADNGEDSSCWADRQARLRLLADQVQVGMLGLLSTRCRRLSGIGQPHVACFELDLGKLRVHPSRENSYRAISELPESDFDLSIVIPAETTWAQVQASAMSIGGLVDSVGFVGEFTGSWVPAGHKSTSIRVTLRPRTTTLTKEDIGHARESVLAALSRDVDAYLRT
jgi:phenylalanyl-tRNA synthetase beta chain